MSVGPAMLTNPHIRWKEYLEKRGQLRGIHDYGRLFDVEMAMQLAAMGMQAGQLGAPQPTGQSTQPRLASDIAGTRPGKSPYGDVQRGRARKSSKPGKMVNGADTQFTPAPSAKNVTP